MIHIRRLAVVALATATLALTGAVTAQAGEVDDMDTLAGPCGSSYGHVGHHEIRAGGVGVVGYFDVYWSTSTKRNCLVVNASGPSYGYRAMKMAAIKFSDQGVGFYEAEGAIDFGFYYYYAGPVYTMPGLDGRGRCIDVLARIDYPGDRAASELTDIHCG